MSSLLSFILEIAIIAIVIMFLPQILGFITVCFALACAFALVTGFQENS
jgi:hypothetical protein